MRSSGAGIYLTRRRGGAELMFHSIIEELFSLADLLGAAADGFENAAKRLDKKILDLAIRGKLVPQDPSDEPASELVERIAASHKPPHQNR